MVQLGVDYILLFSGRSVVQSASGMYAVFEPNKPSVVSCSTVEN